MLEGASHPEELIERAQQLQLPAIACTDRDGLYAATRAHVARRDLAAANQHATPAPRLLLGAQISVSRAASPALPSLVRGPLLEHHDRVILLAQDRRCLLYTSPSPRDGLLSRMPSSA